MKAICGVACAALLVAAPVLAQQMLGQSERTGSASFRYERPVQTGGAGPRRLPIDVTLLAGSQADRSRTPSVGLNDLRFFDSGGQEVPYLLVPNPPETAVWKSAQTLPVAPIETATQKTSGFEVDLGQTVTIDRFRIDGLAPPFLKRLRLEGSGDRARWTLLVAEGTVFNLPEERLVQTELAFTPGPYRYVRVTWDDTRSGQLPRPESSSVREVRNVLPPILLTSSLAFERRPSEPGRSRFRLRLPAARLPIVALDMDIGGTHILREATVYEGRLIGGQVVPHALGKGTLRRVVQGDMTASFLRVPIDAPVEPQLDLVIDDGDNPPSDIRGITAVFSELPWIYFESTADSIVARYGNPSLQMPQYDLEAVRQTLAIDTTMAATWGEASLRAETEVSSAIPALPTVGSSLDAALFRYSRPIAPGTAGLVTVPLDAHVLAHSRGLPFADVRVLDAAGRQVPYLVEQATEPLSLDVTIEPVTTRPSSLPTDTRITVYRVRVPVEGLPESRLVLTTSARVFTRSITVGIEHPRDRRRRDPWFERLATSQWAHANQDSPAPPLTLDVRSFGGRDIFVTVDEGDNTPLPLTSARLLLPSYRLRLFRERDAPLRLAYGRDDLSLPQYDLALLAPQLIGVAATEVMPGEEQDAAPATNVLMSPQLFWGVLIAAVLVLVALVARLVRQSDVQSTPAA